MFLSLRVIPYGRDRDGIESMKGARNSGDKLRGASVRVNPVVENSVQVSVVRFAAWDYDTA